MRHLILLAALAAAGCTSPRDACIARAERDIAGLDAAIAVAEANIARGYALEREVVARNGFVFCTGTGFGDRMHVGLRTCSGTEFRTVERPMPLDIEAEERKLASMVARRPAARERADRAVAACFSGT